MSMKMNIASRLAVLNNLPTQGSVLEMISKRNIRKKIDFSSEEIEKINLKEGKGVITWSSETDSDLDIEFNDSELELLKSIVKIMDDKHIITDNILDFVEEIQK